MAIDIGFEALRCERLVKGSRDEKFLRQRMSALGRYTRASSIPLTIGLKIMDFL